MVVSFVCFCRDDAYSIRPAAFGKRRTRYNVRTLIQKQILYDQRNLLLAYDRIQSDHRR